MFAGNSLAAAGKAAEIEAEAGPVIGDNVEVHVTIPDNGRNPHLLSPEKRAEREAYDKQRARDVARLDKELRKWIVEGKLTEGAALLCRSQWERPGDKRWEPRDGGRKLVGVRDGPTAQKPEPIGKAY